MITLLIRTETPMGPRTRIVREDDEARARETMVLFQEMGATVWMTELVGRKTIPELVRERDKKLNRKRKSAVVVALDSRRA